MVIHWFRKGLRVHDNPALREACVFARSQQVKFLPLYILDPKTFTPDSVGVNRAQLLLETL